MTTPTIQIDKNIPMPSGPNGGTGVTAAIRSLQIGDSFVIPESQRNAVGPAASKLGFSLLTRKQDDGTVRVWRKA